MSRDMPSDSLAYGFVVDATQPSLLRKTMKIFKFAGDDVTVSPNPTVDSWMEYSDSERTAAHNIAASLGVEGCYGAFSGSASMSATTESSSKIKTARFDVYIKATAHTALTSANVQLTPANFLEEAVTDFIIRSTPQQITQRIGEFYAQSCELGGLFRKTHVVEMQEDDTSSSIQAELTASYGVDLVGKVSATTRMQYGTRANNRNAKTKTTWHCEGGDTRVWLAGNDIASTQSKWAESMDDSNLFCYSMKVTPIWELCAAVDQAKGDEVQAYCLSKWKVDGSLTPTEFVKVAVEKIVAKRVGKAQMSRAGDDSGSKAKRDLVYFGYYSGDDGEDWLMLGHSFEGTEMIVVKSGPWVKKATGWKRIWNDDGSGCSKDYDIYVPTCGDKDFLALGCVCVFQNKHHQEPPANSPFACVHKSMCVPVSEGRFLWNDNGTGAKWDVTLVGVPGMGTMWPSVATMYHPGQPHAIRPDACDFGHR